MTGWLRSGKSAGPGRKTHVFLTGKYSHVLTEMENGHERPYNSRLLEAGVDNGGLLTPTDDRKDLCEVPTGNKRKGTEQFGGLADVLEHAVDSFEAVTVLHGHLTPYNKDSLPQ